jgi:hypothetical protein
MPQIQVKTTDAASIRKRPIPTKDDTSTGNKDDETIDRSSPPPKSLPEQTSSLQAERYNEVKKKRKRSHNPSSLKASPFDHLKPGYRLNGRQLNKV